ncbi:MAG: adenine deaminase [Alkaliphilus sp.]|nr:adenine deaminase [bacterium AH-315-L21]MBN4069351.1 adenine deaminase [bacterium AH-315-G05]PHS35906.1 MAG: adenine deaminase [Alkaliphilus sp.]
MLNIKKNIDIAAGRKKAGVVLKNCKIVNVFSNKIVEGDIAIDGGKIIGIGDYEGKKEIDIEGKYVAPGLIDAHVHIESSLVSPCQFARAVVARGTTTVIADPHEIANVCGLSGLGYMLNATSNIPIDVFFMIPSCVPATSYENSGAVLSAKDIELMINHERVLGLGEVMNYPAVINAERDIINKIKIAKTHNKIIDGHGPVISGKELNAYMVSGIKTDHECANETEMIDRLERGMYIAIREGTAAKNLEVLIKAVTPENERRCMFCTDDRHPEDIINSGHIDNNVRLAIKCGTDPIAAIRMATLNTAECYKLENLGAIAPGYNADVIVFDSFKDFNIEKVFKHGKLVVEKGKVMFDGTPVNGDKVENTVNFKKIDKSDLEMHLKTGIVNVIRVLPRSLITEKTVRRVDLDNKGLFKPHKDLDIVKLAVIERHNATGNIGLALVENFQLKNGAIASTVAHDSHNIIVIGDNDGDIMVAINELKRAEGGITLCSQGEVLKTLELPIAGLISKLSMKEVVEILEEMLDLAYNKLNVNREIDPFMTLSFLALPVIPDIKLTDLGLFDVSSFKLIDINVD